VGQTQLKLIVHHRLKTGIYEYTIISFAERDRLWEERRLVLYNQELPKEFEVRSAAQVELPLQRELLKLHIRL